MERRDKSIQDLMILMDPKFEKVWDIPYGIVKIIYAFLWNANDLKHVSSNAIKPKQEQRIKVDVRIENISRDLVRIQNAMASIPSKLMLAVSSNLPGDYHWVDHKMR